MTGRSFRDRYGALITPQPGAPRRQDERTEWPLPRGARFIDTAEGPCVISDRIFQGEPITLAHDTYRLCCDSNAGRFTVPSNIVFLDTETTGLSGGTGTHVFLVGIGRFTAGIFHVRQYFMRHPGDERSLLAGLANDFSRGSTLVTYNGRAFDMPLLDTRCTMHARPPLRLETHIDLLSSARAIWKHRLPNCSLGTIERLVLGVQRDFDAPGWMIPQLYFDYLRTRNISLLEPVFEHNRTDIVSLARLAALVHSYEAGLAIPDQPIDKLSLALHCLRNDWGDTAVEDLKRLWHAPAIPADLRLRGLRQLSVTLKRQHRLAEAAQEWRRALSDPSRAIRLFAAEELAKYLEHGERDHHGAIAIARRGADAAALANDIPALHAFERRLRRLEQKVWRRQQDTAV